jgi:hypothetical protein
MQLPSNGTVGKDTEGEVVVGVLAMLLLPVPVEDTLSRRCCATMYRDAMML